LLLLAYSILFHSILIIGLLFYLWPRPQFLSGEAWSRNSLFMGLNHVALGK
jgi:hypothetical protein